jgi:general secretion pathway protein L
MIGSSAGPALARSLPDENSGKELARSLAAFELSRDVEVTGSLRIGTAIPESGDISLNPELLDAFGGDNVAARDLAGAYAVARAFLSGTIVNFRSGDLAYTAGQMKNLRRLRLTAILAITLVLLIFAEVGGRYWMARKDVLSLETSISKIYREVFPSRKKPQDPLGEISSEIKRLSGGGSSQRILPGLLKLSELKGNDVTGFFEVELEGSQIRLKGDARSTQAVNDFKNRAAAVLASAEVAEIKSKTDGSVSFVFRGTVKKEGSR